MQNSQQKFSMFPTSHNLWYKATDAQLPQRECFNVCVWSGPNFAWVLYLGCFCSHAWALLGGTGIKKTRQLIGCSWKIAGGAGQTDRTNTCKDRKASEGRKDTWKDGDTHKRTDRHIKGRADTRKDSQAHGRTYRHTEGWIDKWKDKQTQGKINRNMEGQTDTQKNGQTHKRAGRHTEGQTGTLKDIQTHGRVDR